MNYAENYGRHEVNKKTGKRMRILGRGCSVNIGRSDLDCLSGSPRAKLKSPNPLQLAKGRKAHSQTAV